MVGSDLPCAGIRVGMRELNPADRACLARAVRTADLQFRADRVVWKRSYSEEEILGIPNARLRSLGYVKSSAVPHGSGVARLELREFCTSAGRLAWAKASGCRWDEWTCAIAAGAGSGEALTWARAHGCLWGEDTCAYAALGGHLNVLRWARENGCPWGARTCAYAAVGGHLDC